MVALAEAPGEKEVLRGRPLIGPSGMELERALNLSGIQRSDIVLDNSLLCWPPLNNLARVEHQYVKARKKIEETNDRRKALGQPTFPLPPSPIECCRPHVIERAKFTRNLLMLGGTAYYALTGEKRGIRRIRGAFIERWLYEDRDSRLRVLRLNSDQDEEEARKAIPASAIPLHIVPTLHPAFILRAGGWRIALDRDVERFKRWMDGKLDWQEPEFISTPSYQQLKSFLYDPTIAFHAIDVEADGLDSLSVNMRCICFDTERGGMVVPFRSVKPVVGNIAAGTAEWRVLGRKGERFSFYRQDEAAAIWILIRAWLLDKTRLKVGHNSRYFDAEILIREFDLDIPPQNHVDTTVLMRANFSEVKRDLYTGGTLLTDVWAWKDSTDGKSKAVEPRSDLHLARYCNCDGTVTARIFPKLLRGAVARGQAEACRLDFEVQDIARNMRRIGMYVDEPARRKLEEEKTAEKRKYKKELRDLVGDSRFNPNSTPMLAALFYDDWRLPILGTSEKTGEASTDDDVLRALIHAKILTDAQLKVILLLRRYRKVSKELSTYIVKLRPWNSYRIDREGNLVGGLTGKDGRVHPNFNTTTPSTGRISSSDPNAQNFPKALRKIIVPMPGHTFVGADYDQIELRLVSAIAGVSAYLEAFRNGGDPHAVTAILIYGEVFVRELLASLTVEQREQYRSTGVPPKADDANATEMYSALRRFAKTFVYAVIYGGTAQTIFNNVSAAEDPKTGDLLFPDMTLQDVRVAYKAWMKNAKEIPAWWAETLQFARLNGYILEPVAGRRRDFPTYEPNEILNHPIQGGAAIVMGRGLVRLVQRMPFEFGGPWTGVINQCHDAETTEIPDTEADIRRAKEATEEALYTEFRGLPFTASANRADNWAKAA